MNRNAIAVVVTPQKTQKTTTKMKKNDAQLLSNDTTKKKRKKGIVLKEVCGTTASTSSAIAVVVSESTASNQVDIGADTEHGTIEPTDYDVICGQSRRCAYHTGNKRFQAIIEKYAGRYKTSSKLTKNEKMTVTKNVVACIHDTNESSNGNNNNCLRGRFLRYNRNTKLWEEINDLAARDKVSHALRTKVASWERQKQKQQEKDEALFHEKEDVDIANTVNTNGDASDGVFGHTKKRRSIHSNNTCQGGRRRRKSSSESRHKRRSSSSSVDSAIVVNDLMKTQKEIFATLRTSSSSSTTTSTILTSPTSAIQTLSGKSLTNATSATNSTTRSPSNEENSSQNHYHDQYSEYSHHYHDITSYPLNMANENNIDDVILRLEEEVFIHSEDLAF